MRVCSAKRWRFAAGSMTLAMAQSGRPIPRAGGSKESGTQNQNRCQRRRQASSESLGGSPRIYAGGSSALSRAGCVRLFSSGFSRGICCVITSIPLKVKWRRIDFCLQSRRGVRKLLGLFHQACFDGIHPDIFNMLRIFICVSDPVLVVTLLPYFKIEAHLLLCAVGESSLDKLHCFLKRSEERRVGKECRS